MNDLPAADALDIHPASPAEREASFHNTHDVWSRGLPLDEHVALRLKSPLHRRANWYVGCLDGQVVTSLAVHPLEFQLRGRRLQGFGIGSVHTLAAYRRRGLAPRLLAWVEDYRRRAGDQLSLLYSDIDPDFYARLGYQRAPALRGWCDRQRQERLVGDLADASRERSPRLERFEGRSGLAEMQRLYEAFHRGRPLSIARTDEYWAHLFERQPDDEYYWVINPSGSRFGYVRLKPKNNELSFVDYGFDQPANNQMVVQATYAVLFRLLVELAHARGAERLGGWMPDLPIAERWFAVTPRTDEIPMFKPLDRTVQLDPEALAGTDCFCELDHV